MIGLAKSVMIIAQNANIIDTILFNLANVVGQLPSLIASYIMFVIQMFINFFVSSGSGQAALTMPILAPLGDLVGISRQLSSFNISIRRWVLKCNVPNIRCINSLLRYGRSSLWKMVKMDITTSSNIIYDSNSIYNNSIFNRMGLRYI